ncbi:hypothetical protein QBC39DRAFT_436390 [Podospora conica]|nr:hypothetical protein QBC39DRAFT_436390 [Schizothecium conicum]
MALEPRSFKAFLEAHLKGEHSRSRQLRGSSNRTDANQKLGTSSNVPRSLVGEKAVPTGNEIDPSSVGPSDVDKSEERPRESLNRSPNTLRSGNLGKEDNTPPPVVLPTEPQSPSVPILPPVVAITAREEEWKTQTMPLSSTGKQIWRFHDNLYFVLPSEASSLSEANIQYWFSEVRLRLWEDLAPARRRIKRKCSLSTPDNSASFEIELRMSGYAEQGADSVECAAAIWILCGGKICRYYVEKAVKKLSWLQGLKLRLEIHIGASVFAAAGGSLGATDAVPLEKLSLERPIVLPNENTLYLHVEEQPAGISSSGRLICASLVGKDGSTIISQRFSRLGGFIYLNLRTRFAVTTAHGIAEYLAPAARDDPSKVDTDNDSGSSSDSDSDFEAKCCNHTGYSGGFSALALGYKDPATVDKWIPVRRTGAINFLGQGAEATDSVRSSWWSRLRVGERRFQTKADFALLDMGMGDRWADNRYALDEETSVTEKSVRIREVKPGRNVGVGPVHVLAGDGRLIGAVLLDEGSRIYTDETWLETRKILLERPIARGMSGSWVVRGGLFCGMVVAVSEHEPFAHIIEAWQLISDIKASYGPGGSASFLGINDPGVGTYTPQPPRNDSLDLRKGKTRSAGKLAEVTIEGPPLPNSHD